MLSQTLARWTLSVVLGVIMLGVWLLGLNQAPISQSHPLATDYTVGGVCGATIQACINNPIVQAGDRILIPAGTYTESLTLNKAVGLLGSNATTTIINAISGQRVLTVTGATIDSSSVISGLTFMGGNLAGADRGGAVWTTSQARPIFENVIITNNNAYLGGGIAADNDLTLINVTILSNTASAGGGIYSDGTIQLIGSLIDGNQSLPNMFTPTGGGGLYAGGLIMTDTVFSNNNSSSDNGGGGARVSDANLTGGQFLNNHDVHGSSTGQSGGGIAVQSTLIASGTQFIGNTSNVGCGGASASSATIINSNFESNQALFSLSNGGGLCASDNATILNSVFVSNTADSYGGGIIASNAVLIGGRLEGNRIMNTSGAGGAVFVWGSLVLTDTDVMSNTSYNNGGGVNANVSASLFGGRFERNVSLYGGGGGLNTSALTLSGTQFISNKAAYSGGGVNTLNNTNLVGGLFVGNQVTSTLADGGGALFANGQLNITGTQFIANTSATKGGAVMHKGSYGAMRIVNALFLRNQASSDGASLYLPSPIGTDVILFSTIADNGFNAKSAILVGIHGALGITNTIIINHAIGINDTGYRTSYQDYNLFFGNTRNLSGTISGGSHNQTGDPLFVDPLNSDYHLKAGSAAIDKGIFAGVLTDLDGNSRLPDYGGLRPDIGAYEYHFQGVIYDTHLPLVRRSN